MILALFCLVGHLLVCFEFQAKRWVDEKKTFFSRKIVGDNYWSWSFLVSSLKIVPYATTDRNSATAGDDDDVTTSGLDVVICGVKTDIGNKSGRRRNLYCVLYILYFLHILLVPEVVIRKHEGLSVITGLGAKIPLVPMLFFLGNQEPIVDKKTAKKGVNKLFIVLSLNRPVQGQPWWSDQIDINFRA